MTGFIIYLTVGIIVSVIALTFVILGILWKDWTFPAFALLVSIFAFICFSDAYSVYQNSKTEQEIMEVGKCLVQ